MNCQTKFFRLIHALVKNRIALIKVNTKQTEVKIGRPSQFQLVVLLIVQLTYQPYFNKGTSKHCLIYCGGYSTEETARLTVDGDGAALLK